MPLSIEQSQYSTTLRQRSKINLEKTNAREGFAIKKLAAQKKRGVTFRLALTSVVKSTDKYLIFFFPKGVHESFRW